MPIQVLMPALSPTMTEGTLAKWLKAEGDKVESGDIIAEVETDKATMEIEAIDDGVVGKILIAEGTEAIPINTPIAVILEDGEDASAVEGMASASNGAEASEPTTPDPAPAPAEKPPAAPAPAAVSPAAPSANARNNGERIFASPLARRMAEQAGLDLATLSGSGPRGRIVKRDIEAAVAGGVSAPAAAGAPVSAPAPSLPADAAVTEVPNSNMRKVIARRLSESKQTVPHFYLTIDCEIDRLLEMRKDLNSRSDAYKISVNDFVVRAVALALRKVPAANAVWTDAATLLYNTVDVSVAVAVDGGLITPVVRNADTKGLATISAEMKDFATRAREGKLMPEEYQGGGFSVSNLGMFGIREFSAIINPPQSGILAIGAGEQRPVVKDGALAVATVMTCSLSGDHRVIDGAVGAEFLAAYKALIEDPLTMLL